MNRISVPFKIKDVYEGFAESSGIISYSEGVIRVQFQTKDTVLGLIKGKINEFELLLEHVQSAEFIKKLLSCHLYISISNLNQEINLPGQDVGEIHLSIEKKNMDLAKSFVAKVQYDLASVNEQHDFDEELRKSKSNRYS